MWIFFAGQGRTRVCGEAYFMYAAAGNPRRTQSSGKKTIYGWTLQDTRWHGCHAIASQNVAAIQPQDGPGHERGVLNHKENRLDHI